jgi:hypothetical protein
MKKFREFVAEARDEANRHKNEAIRHREGSKKWHVAMSLHHEARANGYYASGKNELGDRAQAKSDEHNNKAFGIKEDVLDESKSEALSQHKIEAHQQLIKAGQHKEGTFGHHDAMAKYHFHSAKYRIRSDEHSEKAKAHRAKADKLA